MKRLLSAILLLLPLHTSAVELWQENTHYRVLNQAHSEQPQVVEFFSFWCPHCYNFEPIVKQVNQALADNLNVQKVHVNFMRSAPRSDQDSLTKAMVAARYKGIEPQIVSAIFDAIHKQTKSRTIVGALPDIFAEHGISNSEFNQLMNTPEVLTQLAKNNQTVEANLNNVNGVPTFIINGRYLAIFNRNMTTQDVVDLIVWLSNLKPEQG
jgi:thiol:disulfide interchange protein DsbA